MTDIFLRFQYKIRDKRIMQILQKVGKVVKIIVTFLVLLSSRPYPI